MNALLGREPFAAGDLIAAEVVQRVRSDVEFEQVRRTLSSLFDVELGGFDLAVMAAQNFRVLQAKGITVRKTIDTLIATRCFESQLTLLHNDHDFDGFALHPGLKVDLASVQGDA